ncbi:MAG: hypothetical protein AAGA71_10055 [Pseudomonadota bacterium]
MSSWFPIVAISTVILIVLAVRALIVVRNERDAPRGSLPGKGHHVIDASYFSGGGGGGQSGAFRVPKDPQDYARAFVPRNKDENR